MKIGEFIRIKREELGLTMDALAQRSDINSMTLWRIETGKVKAPGFDTISKIAKALNLSIDSLTRTKKDT